MNHTTQAIYALAERFRAAGIRLYVHKKRVKHINFRVKLGEFHVSCPMNVSDARLLSVIHDRYAWAVAAQDKLAKNASANTQASDYLWSEVFDRVKWLNDHQAQLHARTFKRLQGLPADDCKQWIYRYELANYVDEILAVWQAKVGKSASHISIKSMSSRWGSCNVRTAKIALSTHLVSYPKACTDYVLVHELCHLIHANHSREFWASVQAAMPDYQTWHRLLKGRV